MKDSLRSIDLHLHYDPGEVVETRELVDVACGMYPCYYTVKDQRVLVSTSVTDLIFHLGDFQRNEEFDPPNFIQDEPIVDRLVPSIPNWLIECVPPQIGDLLRSSGMMTSTYWHKEPHTIDRRIKKLQPFDKVTLKGITNEFKPTYSLSDPQVFVKRSADYIQSFINRIEREWPGYHHVARVGGMDSQLILLAPKVSDNWHVFSADPNFDIVHNFIKQNNIDVQRLFHHDNENEESRKELIRKLICSDLQSDPRHLRWYPTLEEIVDEFNGKVIFWCGTEGDTIYSYNTDYQSGTRKKFFDLHQTRAANWQSTTHQVTKNYTGAAALSPYHSEEIWDELYRHYDPDMIKKGVDLRERIGQLLFDNNIIWPDRNPGPKPYQYDINMQPISEYIKYILHRPTTN